jgi:hypothetical protein
MASVPSEKQFHVSQRSVRIKVCLFFSPIHTTQFCPWASRLRALFQNAVAEVLSIVLERTRKNTQIVAGESM